MKPYLILFLSILPAKRILMKVEAPELSYALPPGEQTLPQTLAANVKYLLTQLPAPAIFNLPAHHGNLKASRDELKNYYDFFMAQRAAEKRDGGKKS